MKWIEAKTAISLMLIGCATWLTYVDKLDPATWAVMCTTIGGLWGVAAFAGTRPGKELMRGLAETTTDE